MRPGRRPVFVSVSTLAASLAVNVAAGPADELPPPAAVELRLVWVDLCEMPRWVLDDTTRNIEDLLAPAGIQLSTGRATAGQAGAIEGVMVVLMASDPGRRADARPIGGVARVESGRQLTVWAFPPAVAGGLDLELARQPRWTPVQRLQFARSLAIVVLHELGHALAGAKHRRGGFMSARLDRPLLLDRRITIDADLHAALRQGVAKVPRAAEVGKETGRTADSTR